MATPGPVQFEATSTKNTTLLVTTQDGQKYNLEIALLVLHVADQGLVNPLDGMPLFQIGSQVLTRVTRHTDG